MQELIMGIDEAGRGPVIGPMIICGIVINKEDTLKLTQIGVKDSKLLSESRREKLKILIEEVALSWKLVKISPAEIDCHNINFLYLNAVATLINDSFPQTAIIDCPSRLPASFERQVASLLKNKGTKLVVENFADKNYPIVSAASILAKVARDREMKNLALLHQGIGSGYPSDKKTINFLKKCLEKDKILPEIVRKKWKTIKNLTAALELKHE